jgi:hypothetical protein
MPIFNLKAHLEPISLDKMKHFNPHVINFLVLLIIVKD